MLLFLILHCCGLGYAEDVIEIQVRPGQTIQDVCTEYLGDPNLWPSVLEYNGLERPEDVVPWMKLSIPATGIASATVAINRAEAGLASANRAGARLFASDLLENARRLLDEARDALAEGEYRAAERSADEAFQLARQARRAAVSTRNISVKAILESFEGDVEVQRPGELTWRTAEPRMRLVEGERVRTRRSSSAEIVFRDNSRLRLNANSLAVIRELRHDAVAGGDRSRVALMQGDLVANVSEGQQPDQFNVHLPDIGTRVESRSFWMNRDEVATTRMAVYDGQIGVSAAGDSVVVRENQGTSIRHRRAPERPRKLLPAPSLRAPESNRTFYNDYPVLNWRPLQGAEKYRLEIARDRAFMRAALVEPELQVVRFVPRGLARGVYYWRVSGVDSAGILGPASDPRMFVMKFDRLPPFIVVTHPRRETAFTNEEAIPIRGETEFGASLTVNGRRVDHGMQDRFRYVARLSTGENVFAFTARDSGGNETTVSRTIVLQEHAPDVQISGIESDELSFVTSTPFLSMNGNTEVGAQMALWRFEGRDLTDSAKVPVRRNGEFSITRRIAPGESHFVLEAVDRAGNRAQKRIQVTYDASPPTLELTTPTMIAGRADTVLIHGETEPDAIVMINGEAVAVREGSFSAVRSVEDGVTLFVVTAEDAAGNRRERNVTVVRDSSPPAAGARVVTPRVAGNGDGAGEITIEATDAVAGLARVARYRVISSSGFVHEGIAELVAERRYSGRFPIPPDAHGRLRIEWVEVADRLGNSERRP